MNVLVAIHERRSINFFDPDRGVEPQVLRELLETANLAPSSFNLQPWDVITVQDRENKKKLRACAFDQAKVEEAGAVLILVANPRGVEEHIDPVLDRMIELGYLKPEARERTRGTARGSTPSSSGSRTSSSTSAPTSRRSPATGTRSSPSSSRGTSPSSRRRSTT